MAKTHCKVHTGSASSLMSTNAPSLPQKTHSKDPYLYGSTTHRVHGHVAGHQIGQHLVHDLHCVQNAHALLARALLLRGPTPRQRGKHGRGARAGTWARGGGGFRRAQQGRCGTHQTLRTAAVHHHCAHHTVHKDHDTRLHPQHKPFARLLATDEVTDCDSSLRSSGITVETLRESRHFVVFMTVTQLGAATPAATPAVATHLQFQGLGLRGALFKVLAGGDVCEGDAEAAGGNHHLGINARKYGHLMTKHSYQRQDLEVAGGRRAWKVTRKQIGQVRGYSAATPRDYCGGERPKPKKGASCNSEKSGGTGGGVRESAMSRNIPNESCSHVSHVT